MFYLSALLAHKEEEISDVKSKIAEVMALIPSASSHFSNLNLDLQPSPHFSGNFAQNTMNGMHSIAMDHHRKDDVLSKSSLNPNATDYTPKTL